MSGPSKPGVGRIVAALAAESLGRLSDAERILTPWLDDQPDPRVVAWVRQALAGQHAPWPAGAPSSRGVARPGRVDWPLRRGILPGPGPCAAGSETSTTEVAMRRITGSVSILVGVTVAAAVDGRVRAAGEVAVHQGVRRAFGNADAITQDELKTYEYFLSADALAGPQPAVACVRHGGALHRQPHEGMGPRARRHGHAGRRPASAVPDSVRTREHPDRRAQHEAVGHASAVGRPRRAWRRGRRGRSGAGSGGRRAARASSTARTGRRGGGGGRGGGVVGGRDRAARSSSSSATATSSTRRRRTRTRGSTCAAR